MNESKLIETIRSGDIESYSQLVTRYQTGLIIYCENLLHSRPDAEDIAQESFLVAYQKIQDFDDTKGRFSTWLYRIAANKCIDQLRRTNRITHPEEIETIADIPILENKLAFDEIEQIRAAVAALEPPKFARIIRAYYWEGKSYQVLADEFETSTGTIGTWMKRAKTQLRKELV